MTEWRAVTGWPYEVSDDGRIRRKGGKELTQFKRGKLPYGYVGLSNGPLKWRLGVHQLICAAFHGPRPSDKHEVAHWDGDGTNNAADNLRWATPSDNAADRTRHGRTCSGMKNGSRVITEETVRAILSSGLSIPKASRQFGISKTQVQRILSRQSWRCLTDAVAKRIQHSTSNPGEEHPAAVLTERHVRELRTGTVSIADIAKSTGVSYQTAWSAARGKSWSHVE